MFSPDGRFIAYVSDESGRSEIFVRTFPSSTSKWQVSSGGGASPVWRHDGKEIFYLAPDRTLVAVPITSPRARSRPARPRALFEGRLRRPMALRRRPDGTTWRLRTSRFLSAAPGPGRARDWSATGADGAPMTLVAGHAARPLRDHRAPSAPAAWARCIARTDTKLDRDVAIKVLPAAFARRPGAPRALRARGPDARLAQPPEHRARLRLRGATLPTGRPLASSRWNWWRARTSPSA